MNAVTAQQYARWVGVLYIVTIVAGGWGEAHVPNTLLMANDVAGTAQRVAASLGLFRASFAAYLLEAACDITLNVLLYALLRPVSRNLALLATCFGLMATSVYAAGEMLYFAAALPAVDADLARVISPEAKRRSPIFASPFTGTSTGFSPYSMAPRRWFAGTSFYVPATCPAHLARSLSWGAPALSPRTSWLSPYRSTTCLMYFFLCSWRGATGCSGC